LGFRRMFRFGKQQVLGLDIGTYSVKAVWLNKTAELYTVRAAGLVRIDQQNGDGCDGKNRTVKALRQLLAQLGLKRGLAVCGLSGPEVAVRSFQFPQLPEEEIEGAVTLEASQVCPFSLEQATVDYQLVDNSDQSLRGLFVAATNTLIQSKVRLVEQTSLDCALMDVDGLALLNCFTELEKPDPAETIAILNVGNSYTTLAIVGENGQPFVRDISYAGGAIIEQVATDRGLSIEAVREALQQPSADQSADLRAAVQRACWKVADDVNTTSRYYKAQRRSTAFERIHVCGGFALVDGFVELLSDRLAAKAVLWNPFEKVQFATDRPGSGNALDTEMKKLGPVLAVATGLAMREIRDVHH